MSYIQQINFKNKFLLILLFVLVVQSSRLVLASFPDDHASWWIKEYGLMDTHHKDVVRVHEIFEKLLYVADKSSKQFPSLVVIRQTNSEPARCIKDGTILLTKKALDLCFDSFDKQTGDSHAAFIISHELAHMAFNDFDLKIQKHIELKADNLAVLYMKMAGYNPEVLLREKGLIFFSKWYNILDTKEVKGYPAIDNRVENISSKIKSVIADIDYFDIGIRFYQLGKYEDAIELFKEFKNKFHSREVFSNIGLAYYQMAMMKLAECKKSKLYRFKLSTMVDPVTIAQLYTMRKTEIDCNKKILFKEALRYLKKACDKDPFHLPSLINYTSTLIMLERYSSAISEISDSPVDKHKSDPKILNNVAIAMYLLKTDPYVNVDMTTEACSKLQKAIEKESIFPNTYYNLGRIQYERYRNSSYKKNWQQFLQKEKFGPYAESICKIMAFSVENPVKKDFFITSPVQSGIINEQTEKYLISHFSKKEFDVLDCITYSNEQIKVIAIAGVIEIVEKTVNIGVSDFMEKQYGNPLKKFRLISGKTINVYHKFAIEVDSKLIKKIIYFNER